MATDLIATQLLEVWGEIQAVRRAGDAEVQVYSGRSSLAFPEGSRRRGRSRAPARASSEHLDELTAVVEAALRGLSPLFLEIIRLKFEKRLSDEEVRRQLGLSIGHRGFAALRRDVTQLVILRIAGARRAPGGVAR